MAAGVELLVEDATGQSYDDVVRQRIIEPLGLAATAIDRTPTAGWIGGADGGAISNLDDLATWRVALYRDGAMLSPDTQAAMVRVDESLLGGLGTFPVCPCAPGAPGELRVTSLGHNGGSATLQYSPADGVVVSAAFSESFWLGDFDRSDVDEFLARVRAHVAD